MDDKIAKRITHAEYMKMYETVKDSCMLWAVRLRSGIGERFSFSNKVSVGKDFLKEMREAARTEGTQRHIDVLNEVFGKEEPQPKFKVGDWVRTSGLTSVCRVEDITPIGYKLRSLRGIGPVVDGRDIKPWIPEVGEWVVARGEDKAGQVTICFEHGVATKKCNSYPFNSYHVIENLRPATKEEVEKAKGEGDLFFTEEGVGFLMGVIGGKRYCQPDNLDKIPEHEIKLKAEWINKTITQALKDEGLW